MLINTNDALEGFCAALAKSRFIALDTEFIRDRTYWPRLCLVQAAGEDGLIGAIDPLAVGLDLAPFLTLLENPTIIKVFHAARQDLEIFYALTGKIPAPLADTQVMAMVCGYGEAASYESLVSRIVKASIDKSSRFTDWALRPLSEKQLAYALDDVRHLRPVYEKLENEIKGREAWIHDEMAILNDPAIYHTPPEEAWRRLKVRIDKPRFFTIVKDLAAWREREAQTINIPRGRVVRDETLMEIAHHLPEDEAALARVRGLSGDFARGRMGQAIVDIVKNARTRPPDTLPHDQGRRPMPSHLAPLVDLFRVLLRFVSEETGVAAKLIATTSDLEVLAEGRDNTSPLLQGWRYEIFGKRALELKSGKLALKMEHNRLVFIEV